MSPSSQRPHPPITELLRHMEPLGASDLFLSEGRPPAIRHHGRVRTLDMAPTTTEDLEDLFESHLSPEARKRFEALGDLDVGLGLEEGRRFRLNLGRQMSRFTMVARALPVGELTFEELGLPPAAQRLAGCSRGLVLVTGATGSGKSTTLAAMIHHINLQRQAHVVTVEDPIEFVHRDGRSRITQREVGTDTPSFEAALKHVVRQSPDVILIGEMRDLATMRVALSAALTGHLVLTTLHTIDTTQTLQRILSYFPAHVRAQAALDLSLCLQGVLSQRLLPRKDGEGRVVAVESLVCTPAASRLIREQQVDQLEDLMASSNDPDMCTFDEGVLARYRAGEIDYAVGRAYATNPDEFDLGTKGMSTGTRAFRSDDTASAAALRDLKGLLNLALQRGASDLHLTEGRTPILRIRGDLIALDQEPLSGQEMRTLLFSILNSRQRGAFELERELDFALSVEEGRRFRVNAYHQRGRMAMALRAIPNRIPTAEELGLHPEVLKLGEHPHGLLLVVGPTGSGKTTTQACLLDRLNRSRACRILTIEDPIEYVHESARATVDQREVHNDTRSFAAALRYILRQDPDVILVGEMRDLETISAALTAAETGHLVMATLHSNDAPQTVDRIVDVFPPHQQGQIRSQLASALIGVVSQRLLPARSGRGRVPAFEIMKANPAIRALIRENRMHQALTTIEAGRGAGMVTLDHHLATLVTQRRVLREDALRHARNPLAVERALEQSPPGDARGRRRSR